MIGAGAAVAVMLYLGYFEQPQVRETMDEALRQKTAGGGGGGGKGEGQPKGEGKGKGFGGGGGGGIPGGMMPPGGAGRLNANRNQLEALVAKLDTLTAKPLKIELTDEQRAKVREHLKGLGDVDRLSDDAAKEHLDALLEILKGQKETLEAVGFRWPSENGGPPIPGNPPPNPFKAGDSAKHLQALEQRLNGKAS
jgi:hypothetical protein